MSKRFFFFLVRLYAMTYILWYLFIYYFHLYKHLQHFLIIIIRVLHQFKNEYSARILLLAVFVYL